MAELQDQKLIAISLIKQGGESSFTLFSTEGKEFGSVYDAIREIGAATSSEQLVTVLEGNGVSTNVARKALGADSVSETATDIRKKANDPLGMQDSAQDAGDSFSWREFFDISSEIEGIADAIFDPDKQDVSSRQDLTTSQRILVDAATPEVKDAINTMLDEGVRITDATLREALNETDVDEAVKVIVATASPEDVKTINESAGTSYINESLLTGDLSFLSEEALRARGFTMPLSENHDGMISSGWGVYFKENDQGNLEIFYVDAEGERRALDRRGGDVGKWNPMTGKLDSLTELDSRRPIGMEEGSFLSEGPRTNVIAGRADAVLQDFYELYGWNSDQGYSDKVSGMDFETVLRENVGLPESLIKLSKEGIFPLFEEFDDTSGVQVDLRAQYLQGEATNMFIDMSAERFAGYQKKFEKMGIYEAGQYGRFDPKFLKVVNTTMAYANNNFEANPVGFDRAIEELLANKSSVDAWFGSSSGGGSRRVWRPPAYLTPDYAELSQAVKATFESKLGRAPSNAEVLLLSDKMKADHRGEFDAKVEAQKLQFFGSGGQDAGTVQDTNYAARFQEDFEARYTDELGTVDRIGMQQNVLKNGLGSILAADRAIGY